MYKSLISLIILFLVVIAIIISSVFYNTDDLSSIPNDYAIVFDAGSSGSRMYIYKWKAGYSAAKGDPLVIEQDFSCKTDDNGLDKITSKQELIDKYSKCIEKGKLKIPESRKKRAYIFLAATAGMRLLEVRNKTLCDQIFGFVREYFQSLDFLFTNSSQVRIISGKEEGTNAWISANYYEKNFGTGKGTKGILDLGGASTQIVFEPDNPNPKYQKYFSDLRIYGRNYKPYSYSFLCWGINEINLLYQTYLLTKSDYSLNSNASCFPKSSKLKLSPIQILSSPCANGMVFNYTYNFTANITRLNPNTTYSFLGESNHENCQKELNIILPKPTCTYDNDQCSFNGVYQPPIGQENFMGFSGFYYALSNTEKLLKSFFQNDLPGFKNATNFICSKSLQELIELNKTNDAGLNEKYLTGLCFSNSYVLSLASNYGFNTTKNLLITDKINGYSLNWALGYLVNELNRDDFLPYEALPRKLSASVYIPLVVGLSSTLLVLVAFLIYKKVYLNSKRNTIPINKNANSLDEQEIL